MGSAGLHFQSGDSTLWAVVVGAVLATVGGFVATQFEGFLRRRERERSAALLFGELLSVLAIIATMADESRGRGDPYGPLTTRLLRAVRREAETYDRNREALFDLRDGKIRARIHTLMVRVTLALDGVFDATGQIALADAAAGAPGLDDAAKAQALARLDTLLADRDLSFDFVVETVAQIKPIVSTLEPLARQSFDAHAAVARDL
ncbi:MAG TPA: hypothetical protein VGI79_12480 [Caulobacteraceae bacterium]